MGARIVTKRHNHRTAGAAWDYQMQDHLDLGFAEAVKIRRGDGTLIGRVNRLQFIQFARGIGLNGEKLRRPHPRASQGELLSLTVPANIAGAMKVAGLLDDQRKAFKLLRPAYREAMKVANQHTFGRTTGGTPVKAELRYATFAGYTNRSGELALQLNVWLFSSVQAKSGKRYALHLTPLLNAQQKIQSAFHLSLANTLAKKAGILCGPKGHSFMAFGAKTKTKRSKQIKEKLKKNRQHGNAARQRAAKETRGPKPKTSWGAAVKALKTEVTGRLHRTVKVYRRVAETRYARRCVKLGFQYCNENARRYSSADAYAAGAHLALPRVRASVFDREFQRLTQTPERVGAAAVKAYRDGNVLYSSIKDMRAEEKAGAALWSMTHKDRGSLSRKTIAKAFAARGFGAETFAAVQELAGGPQLVVAPRLDKDALRHTAELYRSKGREVYAVGAQAGKALDVHPLTAHGLAEALTRTSYLQSLWRGMHTPGPLAHKLWAAAKIRMDSHTKLGKGALVVMSAPDASDAKAVTRLAEAAQKAGAKFILTGPGAKEYAALIAQHTRASAEVAKVREHQLAQQKGGMKL
ncbi:MAG: hypothetical protein U0804_01220 [Gemmataceae bacterium]